MALFNKTKKVSKKQEQKAGALKVRHARATKLQNGVAHDMLRAPWFSEKSLIATDKGIYVFAVSKRSTKAEIASAIREVYKVEPRMIRIVNLPAKRKSLRTRHGIGVRSARHKAYVYLNAGDTIQFS